MPRISDPETVANRLYTDVLRLEKVIPREHLPHLQQIGQLLAELAGKLGSSRLAKLEQRLKKQGTLTGDPKVAEAYFRQYDQPKPAQPTPARSEKDELWDQWRSWLIAVFDANLPGTIQPARVQFADALIPIDKARAIELFKEVHEMFPHVYIWDEPPEYDPATDAVDPKYSWDRPLPEQQP